MTWTLFAVSWIVVGFLHALYEYFTAARRGNETTDEWILMFVWFTIGGYIGVLITLYEKITER
jgi:hypothetical protein